MTRRRPWWACWRRPVRTYLLRLIGANGRDVAEIPLAIVDGYLTPMPGSRWPSALVMPQAVSHVCIETLVDGERV